MVESSSAARFDAARVEVRAAAGDQVVRPRRARRREEEDPVAEVDPVPRRHHGRPRPGVAQAEVHVVGGLRLQVGPPRAPGHLQQAVGQRLEVLRVAGEELQPLHRRRPRHAAGEEGVRVGIDADVGRRAEPVRAADADQVLLHAAAQGEGARVDRVLDVPLEDVLRERPVVLPPVRHLVEARADPGVDHLVPVAPQVAAAVLIPQTRPQPVAAFADGVEPLLVGGQTETLLAVVAVAVGLQGNGARRMAGGVVFRARAAVGEDDRGHATRAGCERDAVGTDEVELSEGPPAEHRAPVHQLGLGSARIVGQVHDVRRQPVAAPHLPVVVDAPAEGQDVGERDVGLQIAERVAPRDGPSRPVELIDVGHAGPVVDQSIPPRVQLVVGGREQPLVADRVRVVVGEVGRQVGGTRGRTGLPSADRRDRIAEGRREMVKSLLVCERRAARGCLPVRGSMRVRVRFSAPRSRSLRW